MRFKYNVLEFFVTLFFVFIAQRAVASCAGYTEPVQLDIKVNYGKIYYDNTKSNSQFPSKPYATTMGLTVTELKQNLRADTKVIPLRDGTFCVALDTIHIDLGFPRIDIYIDKKYRPGTCNYRVIKTHEEYHARVQQEGLKFFEPKIRKAFQIAARKLKSEQAFSESQVHALAESMLGRVMKDVKPTMDFVQKRLREENMVIDTPESYEAETKKCPSW